MARKCAKCVFAIGAGVVIGGILALCSHGCYLWATLGLGLAIGTCMAIGEVFPVSESQS